MIEKKIRPTFSLNVLVVGGAGYIGSHVTQALVEAGHRPTVFDNLSSGLKKNLLPEVPFIHGDLLLPHSIAAALEKQDAVIHLAALKAAGDSMLHPEKYATHNLTGTLNLLNAVSAAGISKFIFSSTAAVYGTPQYSPVDENHPTAPINFYGHTKRAIEELLEWYDRLKGIHAVSLRYFNAAGYDVQGKIKGLEQNPQNLFPILMEAVMGKREFVSVFGQDYDTPDGTGVRDYIHVTDLADGHVRALHYLMETNKSAVFNLGTSQGLSVMEIVKMSQQLSQVEFAVKIAPRRAGDPAVLVADSTRAFQVLGWEAKNSDAHTLVKTMLNAYRSQ